MNSYKLHVLVPSYTKFEENQSIMLKIEPENQIEV